MAEGYQSINGITAVAAWTATQTNANNVRLTNDITFPEKGIWIFFISIPNVTSGTGILHIDTSNAYALSSPNYFPITDLGRQSIILKVIADNTIACLKTSSSTEVKYALLDRGSISAVKIA